MDTTDFLYLIKNIEDNKVQLVTKIETIDGVVMSEGRICAVLKRYTPPVDMAEALADIQKFSSAVPAVVKQLGKKPSGKIYTDHLGNEFETVFQMCAYYKISESKYRSRIAGGWSQEEALTGVRKKKRVTDHLGNVFNSKTEMCQFYGIRESLFKARINAGMTLEEALMGMNDESELAVEDHLGNKYKNTSQMCKAYGVRLDTYCHRKNRGWSLEEILTGKKKSEPVTDHKGVSYPDIEEMCIEYGVKKSNYMSRISKGWTVEEALTGVKKDSVVYDHLGNMFLSQKEMCENYGIKLGTFRVRMKNGFTLEEALTTAIGDQRKSHGKTVSDHLGNTYPSIREMCIAYEVNDSTYQCRIRNGYTVEEALTGKRKKVVQPLTPKVPKVKKQKPAKKIVPKKPKNSVTDHLGNEYDSTLEMCKAYGIRVDTFKYRLEQGWNLEDALTKPANSSVTKKSVIDHKGVQYESITEMCDAYGVRVATYKYRRERGWDVERSLTTPLNSGSIVPPKERDFLHFDHKGNGYHSKAEMCKAYGISLYTFKKRQADGLSLQDSLELPVIKERSFTFKDHNGVEYENLKEMCAAWNISVHTYQKRVSKGYSLEKALTEPDDSVTITDHKGNRYPTIQSMCAAYGISVSLYTSRIKRGKSIEEALETPLENNSVEYDGKTYASLKELAEEHHTNAGTLRSRLKLGWSLDEAVTGVKKSRVCYDHLGKEYKSQKEMCQAYGIEPATYQGRIRNGWTVEKALLSKF